MDREKVITEIEDALSDNLAKAGHVYRMSLNGLKDKALKDALTMLKEQEAVEPIPYHRSDGTIFKYECRQCRTKIFKMDLFCRHCGQAVKWE